MQSSCMAILTNKLRQIYSCFVSTEWYEAAGLYQLFISGFNISPSNSVGTTISRIQYSFPTKEISWGEKP